MTNEGYEKSSPDDRVTRIDTTGLMLAQILKDVQMLTRDVSEIKSALKRSKN